MLQHSPAALRSGACVRLLIALVVACQWVPTARADAAIGVCAQDAANDLREWPQLLAKGVRSLRVHPYYLTNAECRAFGQRSNRGGCLVLSHDAPHTARQDWNSTNELVTTVLALSRFWPLGAPPSYLLLDFRAVPLDACNAGTDWHSVVAQFANFAQRALKKVALRLVVASTSAKQQCLRYALLASLCVRTCVFACAP